MAVIDYSILSTTEKIQLVEEIWDSIAADAVELDPAQKKLLDARLAESEHSSERMDWEHLKAKVRAKKRA